MKVKIRQKKWHSTKYQILDLWHASQLLDWVGRYAHYFFPFPLYIDTFVYKVILLHRSRLSKTRVKSLYYKVLIYKISIWSCNFDEEYDLDWSNQAI
jgi:hypothetical protein